MSSFVRQAPGAVQTAQVPLAVLRASARTTPLPRALKLEVGWRFAPACCAAQSVSRRGPCCTVHSRGHCRPLIYALPLGKVSAHRQRHPASVRWSHNFTIPLFALQCNLTIRSTGPIAAGRHLGYKSLAQIPAHHNGPVSSNVRRQRHRTHLPT